MDVTVFITFYRQNDDIVYYDEKISTNDIPFIEMPLVSLLGLYCNIHIVINSIVNI